jgi:hypothetical protein
VQDGVRPDEREQGAEVAAQPDRDRRYQIG